MKSFLAWVHTIGGKCLSPLLGELNQNVQYLSRKLSELLPYLGKFFLVHDEALGDMRL